MAVTVTLREAKPQKISRHHTMLTGTVTFDTSYPLGGESLTDISKYFTSVEDIRFDDCLGFKVEYDRTGNKAIVRRPAPPLVIIDEYCAKTTATNTVTLNYLPCHIIDVEGFDKTAWITHQVQPTGETVATHGVLVNYTTGVLTFKTADKVTKTKVTYMPLCALLQDSDLVVDESHTITVTAAATADKSFNLTYDAVTLDYTWNDTLSENIVLGDKGWTATATKVGMIDWTSTAGYTKITIDSSDITASITLKCTYIKTNTSNPWTLIEEEAVTLSSESGTANCIGIPCTAEAIADAGTIKVCKLKSSKLATASLAAGQASWTYDAGNGKGVLSFNESSSVTGCKWNYLAVDPALPCPRMPEFKSGGDASFLTVNFVAIGKC